MSKKFGCGASVSNDEVHGEVILVQGDIEEEDKFTNFIQKELKQYNIPLDKVIFEEKKKPKTEEEGESDK